MIEEAGERGVAVLVGSANGEFFFLLQFRSISAADEAGMANREPSPQEAGDDLLDQIEPSQTKRINHCTFCGTRLAEVAAANKSHFAALAETHRRFHSYHGGGLEQ